jgi:hypothetical protein
MIQFRQQITHKVPAFPLQADLFRTVKIDGSLRNSFIGPESNEGFSPGSFSATHKKAPYGAVLWVAEKEGFEPSIRY